MLKQFTNNIGLILSLSIIIFISSCKEPDDIGLIIQPTGDLLEANYIDTFTVVAYTVIDDSISTDEVFYNLLGAYFDPVFGYTNAAFYSQFRLPESNVNFGENPILDSAFLCLAYSGDYYGKNTTNQIKVRVLEVFENLYKDSTYYCYSQHQTDVNYIASQNVVPNIEDSVVVDGITYAPHLRVKLDPAWAQKFMDASATDLENNDNFLQFFKGLYVDAEPLGSPTKQGSILYFNMISSLSNITLYYHNSEDTEANYSLVVNGECARYNVFNHNGYTDAHTDLQQQLSGNMAGGKDNLFLQPMAGTKIKINFPHFENMDKFAINKAVLIIPVDEIFSDIDNYSPPNNLSLVKLDSEGNYQFVQDQAMSSATFGGAYDETNKRYVFLLSRYLQDLILGKEEDYGLYLMVSGSAINANRVVLNGTACENQFKIAVTYTVLD